MGAFHTTVSSSPGSEGDVSSHSSNPRAARGSSEAGVIGRVMRWVGVVGVAALALSAGRAGAVTYYVEAATAVNVGVDGSTNMTTLGDLGVSAVGAINEFRAITNTTAPTGTNRYRVRMASGTAETATGQEFLRAYTPVYPSGITIAANATAYADFYMNTTGGTSAVAWATLYEYSDATGIVGLAKGSVSFTGNVGVSTRQTLNGSFGNSQFTVGAGNRLLVIYSFDMGSSRPAFLWGQSASTTPSGYQSFTVTESAAAPALTIGNGTDPGAASFAPGTLTKIDAFTLVVASGTSTVSAVNVALTGNTGLTSLVLYSGTACSGTPLGTVTSPTATPSFTGLALNLTTTAASYSLCAVGGAVAANTTVSGNVSGVTYSGTFAVTDSDTSPNMTLSASTVTIGNGTEPGNGTIYAGQTDAMDAFTLTSSYLTPTVNSVTVALTGATSVSTVSIDSAATCNGTSYGSTTTVGASTTVTTTGLTANGGTYYVCVTASSTAGTVSGNLSGASVTNYAVTDSDTGSSTITVASTPALTIGNGTDPVAASFAPGTLTKIDAFTLAVASGTSTVSAVNVALTGNTGLTSLELRSSTTCTGTLLGTVSSPTATPSFTGLNLSVTTTAANYSLCAVGGAVAANTTVSGNVSGVTYSGTFAVTDSDTSPNMTLSASTVTLGNGAAEPGNSSIYTGQTAGLDAFVLTSSFGAPAVSSVTLALVGATSVSTVSIDTAAACNGTSYGSTTTVGASTTVTTPGLTADGGTYYVCVTASSTAGTVTGTLSGASVSNYAVTDSDTGSSTVTVTPYVFDGDNTPDSTKPVVSIINPMDGAVLTPGTGGARIQIRAFSPDSTPLTVTLVVDGVNKAPVMLAGYGSVNTRGVWEYRLVAADDAGADKTVTLRAFASNTSGGPIYSSTLTVKLSAGKGDGNLLVRDNASQLCSDCHASAMSHSSENVGSRYGSWATTCRDCHTPHGTRNLSLVRETIDPPDRTAPTAPVTGIKLYNRNGFAADSYAQTGAAAGQTGVCEVCHTQTTYYQADGTPEQAGHFTTNCGGCHKHTKGLGASCVACHGDESETRTAATGADSKFQAAPPRVSTSPNPEPNVFVANGGEHLAHVTLATYRSAPLLCSDCHAGSTHQPTPQVDIGYSAVAKGTILDANMVPLAGALASAWTTPSSNANCTNWCHGDGLAGGGRGLAWNWATAQATTCASCHGQATGPVPMPDLANAHHPQNSACANCHGAGYATTGIVAPAATTHVDGTVQHGTGCRACHGVIQPAGTTPVADNTDFAAAPGYDATAVDSKGNVARSSVGVGAHVKHVNAGTFMSGKCAQCHTVPASGITHADGALAWSWTAVEGVTPSYTAPNCTNYCHSNARPLGQASATTASVSWTSTTTPMNCTACHATAAFGGTGLSTRHAKHVSTNAYTCDECHAATMQDNSSGVVGTLANHVNGAKDVSFSATAGAAGLDQSGGSYTSTVTTPNYTCASTYCHSGGVSTTPGAFSATASAAIAWNSAATTTCQTCHGFTAAAAPTMGVAAGSSFAGSAAHMNHVANASVIGTNYVCGACHQNTVGAATDSPITTASNHVNGVKDVSIAPRGTRVTTQTYVSPTCGTTYCHSSGQRTASFVSAAWNSAAWLNKCNGCHGTSTATGAPDYANGGINTASSNSHAKHVGASTDCAKCHNGFVDAAGTAIAGSSHTNGAIEASIAAGLRGSNFAYVAGTATPTSATCAGITCHGNNATAVVWGGPAQTCSSCHGTTGVEVEDLGANFWNNGVAATINTTEWSYSGHGKASGTYDVTLNPAANFLTSPTPGTSECMFCHDSGVSHYTPTNPFRLRGVTDANGVSAAYATSTATLANAVCLNCHSLTANGVDPDGTVTAYTRKQATLKDPGIHQGAKHTVATLGGKFCWDCHDPHGDRPNSTTNNIAMLGKSVTAVSDGTYGYVGGTGVTRAITYNTEAATPPATGKAVETTTAAGAQHIGICQACHADTTDTLLASTAWTKYWNRLGRDDTDGVGGAAPTNSGAASHNYGSATVPYCISCHSHKSGFGGECVGCHATTQPITKGPLAGAGTRPNIVAEFKNTWSHKRSTSPTNTANITVSNADCTVCHMEGEAATATPSSVHGDGYVDLRDPDTGNQITDATWGGSGAGTYTTGATVVRFGRFSRDLTKPLEGTSPDPNAGIVQAIMINQCMSCHDALGAESSLARVPGTGTAEKPFGTTVTYTTTPINPSGPGVTANGVSGGVIDLASAFATTNSSYHPILGKQNNSYCQGTRMVAPWNMTKTTGNATSWGYLMSCWDCHALSTDAGVITRTVTAHGATATVRGSPTATGTAPTATTGSTLCKICHAGYETCASENHCAGSAFGTTSGQSPMSTYLRYGCNRCHASRYDTAQVRPIRGEDVHGVNALPTGGLTPTAGSRWAGAALGSPTPVVNTRPYAFIRNTGSLKNHTPLVIDGTTYTTNCVMGVSPCGTDRSKSYTVGGTF